MPASSALPSGGQFVPRGDLPRRIHQIVEPWASRQPAAPALLLGETVVSYGELAAAAAEAAHRLTEKGLRPGDRLLLAGRLADRFPSNRVAMAGLACFSVSAILMGLSSAVTSFWLLAFWVAIGRVGLALIPAWMMTDRTQRPLSA